MKKLILILFVLFSMVYVNAQTVEDFESIALNVMLGGTEDLSTMTAVANPDPSGINTSGIAVKYVRDKDGVPWGGFWSALASSVDLTTNKYVHVKVWKPRISPVKFKMEGGPSGNSEILSINPQATTEAWEELVFDFSALTGEYPVIAFMPDFEDPLTLTENDTIYFDDIYVSDEATVGADADYTIENFEYIPINAMLGGAEDLSTFTLLPNPDQSGINTSNMVMEFLRDKDGVAWGGFWSNLPTPVDVTTNKYVHVKVWKPRVSPIKFKLEGSPTLEIASMYPQTKTDKWEDIVFDFSTLTGNYSVISLMPDFEDPLTLTEDITIYFDDILINNDSMPMIITYDVTFNVDMTDSIASGYFVEGTDELWVGGSVNGWTMPGDDAAYEMAESATPDIYTLTVQLEDGDYVYKYFKIVGGVSSWDNGEWNGDPNRAFSVAGADVTLDNVFGLLVGVNDISKGISIYPNPSYGMFNINVTNSMNLEVFDITGKLVNTKRLSGLSNIEIKTAGVYFLRFSNEEGSTTQKVIVQ